MKNIFEKMMKGSLLFLTLLLLFFVSACSPKLPTTISTATSATPTYTPIPNPVWTPDPREQYQPPSLALCTELSTWDHTYDINVDLGSSQYENFDIDASTDQILGSVFGFDAQMNLDDQYNATVSLVYCSVDVVNGNVTAVTPCGGTTGVTCPTTCGGSNDPACI